MKKSIFTVSFFIGVSFLLSTGNLWAADPDLANDDCVKCHTQIAHENLADGAKHLSEVGCLDCHVGGHPPGITKGDMVPQCSMCHEGEPHYEVPNCLGCHANPHQPLRIVFGEDNVAVCNTCHTDQVSEVQDNPSAHGEFDCASCHHDKHGYIPDCMECHEPHRTGQTYSVCLTCHLVHQPTNVTYVESVPNQDCGACHAEITTLLVSGLSKHAALQCAACHKDTHGYIPGCTECHDSPHPATMMKKFPNCLDCHTDPHDLDI